MRSAVLSCGQTGMTGTLAPQSSLYKVVIFLMSLHVIELFRILPRYRYEDSCTGPQPSPNTADLVPGTGQKQKYSSKYSRSTY